MKFEKLNWPIGQPRTPKLSQKQARFNKDGKSITIAEAKRRLIREIELWTKSGQKWRIPHDSIIVTANWSVTEKGTVRSEKEPDDSGVAVYFELDGENYCLPCDQWNRAADNLAAIAAHLGAMRDQERWGVGTTKQSFQGYAALPPIAISPDEEWWQILKVSPNATLNEAKEAYRKLAKTNHPDVGGNRKDWDKIQKAWEIAQSQK
ncbi:J domain-containing protein [Synechococcus sp. PCC 6312]|uniref:J domain-containing protein n=1 Tax=Synechococcus sp. (strain ATCC 27167 / PCC 6312) TaxID=195253 RepID=UPI00029EC668|nr:J domain-containing protein [Synechococcus sp. PCC 6312]AFY61936.1 DnaJ-class molecular chaperone with C-terminal Zn finger domain [Synechococcus sp. PCC 6312]